MNKARGSDEIPADLFKIVKVAAAKCCINVRKNGKLSSDHSIGRGQFSFQSQRRAMLKNAQTNVQLYSFHMLASLCSKSFKLGFSTIWTEKFQMYKLGLEKAEEPEVKVPKFTESWRKQGTSRKTSTSASLTTLKPLMVWITTNWKILKEMGIPDHLNLSPERPICELRSNSQNHTWNNLLVQNWERSMTSLYIVNQLI